MAASEWVQEAYDKVSVGEGLGPTYDQATASAHKGRRSGIVLHPTSLPGPYGIGEIGEQARSFIDWLSAAGLQAWQVLPLVPPETEYWSPYTGLDALCGNTLLIDTDTLIEEGLLDKADRPATVPAGDADFAAVQKVKVPLLQKAAERLLTSPKYKSEAAAVKAFRADNPWVEESALFYALVTYVPELKDKEWWTWPEPLRFRDPAALEDARKEHKDAVDRFIALQYIFDKQWKAVKAYANSKGVKLIGDMPIYVGGQGADVWAFQELFLLTESGAPAFVSGVPPDAFSATGQLWGTPLYDWKAHKAEGYKWWVQRLGRCFQLHDETRIDHFRAFTGYWAVPAADDTAMNGEWLKGPGLELFQALNKALGDVPIIAEDLGVITPDVVQLREELDAPGMVVLQFAWGGGGANTHLPHNHYENAVCYPGTHDNDTTAGWWKEAAGEQDKTYLKQYTGYEGDDLAWEFIRLSMSSVARTAIFTMQDVMRVGNEGRMNTPGRAAGNWAWRMNGDGETIWQELQAEAKGLRTLCKAYDRLPAGAADDEDAVDAEGEPAAAAGNGAGPVAKTPVATA